MSISQVNRASMGAIMAVAALLAGCPSQEPGGRGAVWKEGIPSFASWAAVPFGDGFAVAYYDQDKQVQVETPAGLIFDSRKEYPAGHLSGIALAAQGDRLWWAFRPKEPVREIAIRSSDGRKLSIDATGLPLPRITLLPGNSGDLTVFWAGETDLAGAVKEPSIGRAVFDAGGKLADIGDALPGELPAITRLEDGRALLVTNHGYADGGKVSARLEGAEPTVAEVASGVLPVQPTGGFAAGKRMFAYWTNNSQGKEGNHPLEMAYSDDGRDWQRSTLDWNPKDYPFQVSAAGDGRGNLIMSVLTGIPSASGGQANRVKLFHSGDGGEHWQGPFDARAKPYDYAKEEAAVVRFLSNGQFLVLWTDWRYARPTLRYSLFQPGSPEPVLKDAPFAPQIGAVAELPIRSPEQSVFETGGQVKVVAERPADSTKTKSLVAVTRELARLGMPPMEPSAPNALRLEARVNALGKAMVEKRYADAYKFYDPFYRASVSLKNFLETQGRIQYKTYRFLEKSEIQGIAANAKVKIVASVPAFTTGKARFEAAEKEMESVGRWLWIDGEWYYEFYSQAMEKRYTQH